jgi:hypothetical protein
MFSFSRHRGLDRSLVEAGPLVHDDFIDPLNPVAVAMQWEVMPAS